jgi:hypothetical protein
MVAQNYGFILKNLYLKHGKAFFLRKSKKKREF